jgi:hypothetical protein
METSFPQTFLPAAITSKSVAIRMTGNDKDENWNAGVGVELGGELQD